MVLSVICAKPGCSAEFEKSHHNQKYCPSHKTPHNRQRYAYVREALEEHPDASGSEPAKPLRVKCGRIGCQRKVDPKHGRLYCSATCKEKVHAERKRKRKALAKVEAGELEEPENRHARKGSVYAEMVRLELAPAIKNGSITTAIAAEILGCSQSAASRAYAAWEFEHAREVAATGWSRSRRVDAMLPAGALHELRELGKTKDGTSSPRFEELLNQLVRAHVIFARRYTQLEGERVIYKPFHIKWVRLLLIAFATGGKQMILSPPRHGKSELLIRFVLWLIIMDPNLRIMWVCANTDVSKLMLGAVKDYLENHEDLIRDTLKPGDTYKPDHRAGKPWSSKEIKVRQQSHIGAKSSSLLALGRTSKILSRDVDWLIVDDLEDFDSTREPGQRQYSRNKFAEIGSRKMRRTAWIYIGSRNHPDDIPNYLIKSGEKTQWRHIVYSAHDDTCGADPNNPDAHQDGCMLFPEVNDYEWLLEKMIEMDDLGLPGAFEMRYLNKPIPTDGIVFNMEQIKENALNWSRIIGLDQLPAGKLIAGLDPSSRGTQAAVLWHYANAHLSLVDIETQEAGGFAGALRIMQQWYDMYGLTDWYYEDNSQQIEFFNDPRLIALKRELGLTVTPHTTGKNKQDPELGLTGMAPFYHGGDIDLPYGNDESRRKVNVLLRQLELWTTDGVLRKKGKSDVKMASWFPFPRVVRWMRKDRHQNRITGHRQKGYPKMKSTNTFRRTAYPRSRR